MADLMHDFDVVSRVSSLIGTLRSSYDGLNTSVTSKILADIQTAIRQKDDEMSYVDACCLRIAVRNHAVGGRDSSGSSGTGGKETYTFQTRDPNVKKEWIVEMRLAQLALDPANSPGWDVLEQERSISTKMPLYVRSLPVFRYGEASPGGKQPAQQQQCEVNCGASYSLMVPTPTRTLRKHTYVWTNAARTATPGHPPAGSHLRVFSVPGQQNGLKELGTIELPELTVRAIQFVPGMNGGVVPSVAPSNSDEQLRGDTVWVATDSNAIIIYSASDPEKGTELARAILPAAPRSLAHHCDAVWAGTDGGQLVCFRRGPYGGAWDLLAPRDLSLGSEPVSCVFPISSGLVYAACGRRVWVVDAYTCEQVKSFLVQPRQPLGQAVSSPASSTPTRTSSPCGSPPSSVSSGSVHQMAQSGVGLWVALKNSATICLYHTETFRHLQVIWSTKPFI